MSIQQIRHEYTIRATPQRAFEVYATRIDEWWPATYSADPATFTAVHIDDTVGGSVQALHDGGVTYIWGEVTAWEPGERLSYTSTLAQTGESPSQITVTFAPHPDGCRVVFEHGGWDEINEPDRRKFGDWQLILKGFIDLAEGTD